MFKPLDSKQLTQTLAIGRIPRDSMYRIHTGKADQETSDEQCQNTPIEAEQPCKPEPDLEDRNYSRDGGSHCYGNKTPRFKTLAEDINIFDLCRTRHCYK